MIVPRLQSVLHDLGMASQFLSRLPFYLRNPLTIVESRSILEQRLEHRERDFIDLVRMAVFQNPASPYYPLLRAAGCEPADLEHLVQREGIEEGLGKLFDAGVYLTSDEYKGRRPVVRGSTTFTVQPHKLQNPLMVPHFRAKTSGSRGHSTRIPFDLACVRDHAVNTLLTLQARGGTGWRNAVWAMPGIIPILWFSMCGEPAERWFWNISEGTPDLSRWLLWKAHIITWTGRLIGIAMPRHEFAPYDDPRIIADWMIQTLGEGQVPHLWTAPSLALQVCRMSEARGLDLSGAQFTLTGEPILEPHLSAIRRVHAAALPDYGSVDSGGSFSGGCLAPEAPDDVHLFEDLNAVIQVDKPPFPKRALLLSSIRPTSPFVFLNVSMGDTAMLTRRRCGCPMQTLGWRTHLHTIRSFEKLNAGGVTFADADVVHILSDVLPQAFGGGPTDYQLVEDLSQGDQPRLRLLVHPRVGPVDSELLSTTFLEALGHHSEPYRAMAMQWRENGFLGVIRRTPYATSSGKILHIWAAPTTRSESGDE